LILDALIAQILQRFQLEKRANVCLWFDPSREFARLLPAFRSHLESLAQVPVQLLEYEACTHHGQVWLKHQVYSVMADVPPAERSEQRFLLYLPLPEDRLDTPGERGEHHLELLEEFRVAGLIWRIGGKRPTLFRFLREAGVPLTTAAAEQRKLYEGGHDSLLAKYTAKFAERPREFWQAQLTPAIAQNRLLGDADQTLIQLAIDPETTWAELEAKGLTAEFLAAVQERYGFVHPTPSPVEWLQAFVATLALTETFQGYGEPADFPFADRLPPLAARPLMEDLLKRWLRDSQGRAAWDHCIAAVEADLDLSVWASTREGLSFAFPHLVQQRWDQVRAELEAAAGKISETEAFLAERKELIKLEAEYARSSDNPIGGWGALLALAGFVEQCRLGEHQAAGATGCGDLAQVYLSNALGIERQHVVLRRDAEDLGLHAISQIADRSYAAYTNALNGRFFKAYATSKTPAIDGVPAVTAKLEQGLWGVSQRQAVIIVDALRYDCALAIAGLLKGQDVAVEPMLAELPTITPIGMTALMPISGAEVALKVGANNLQPFVNGKDCSQRSERMKFMESFGADCRQIEAIEVTNQPPDDLGNLLVVVGHDQVDHIGHGSAATLIRHLDIEMDRIARLIRTLHRWGYELIHVLTDHGFILLEESKLPAEVACDKGWCLVRKERYALIPAQADVPLATFQCSWDSTVRVAVPPGLAFFMAEKSFSHGGASLQELIIPHLVSKSAAKADKRIGVEVVLPTYELMRTGVKVVIRPMIEGAAGQMSLFTGIGRTLCFDVRRQNVGTEPGERVLASPQPKELVLEPGKGEQSVTLFFQTTQSFKKGELLELDIRDRDTGEQFPPGGIKLTIGRDM
jgi:hypothetical protein